MFQLLLTMVERLGIIVTIAFVLTRFPFFRDLIYSDHLKRRQQFLAILFFGFFGIIGTYSGLTLSTETLEFSSWTIGLNSDEAIANSRVIGVVMAGLLGGYRVGVGAGLIAGLHRLTLGGFTAVACSLAAVLAGLIAGFFYKKNQHVKLRTGFLIGILAESIQMLVILLLAKPLEKAWALVEIIGIPMILANGLGCALFLLIIRSVIHEEERTEALQAQRTLRIAEKTLAFLRQGLSEESAHAVCRILHEEIRTSAVAITDTTTILAHIGLGDDHHRSGRLIQTRITEDALLNGKTIVAGPDAVGCRHKSCPLGAVAVAPLHQRGNIVGTLKFYFRSEKEITPVNLELVKGLSSLLSSQLEIAELDRIEQLAKEAEIKALQAQISPHFLFNALNTIMSLIRLDPTKARKLLLSLSHFLRQNLNSTTQRVTTLEQELRQVKAYLSLEETRFLHRLHVDYKIEDTVLTQLLPPLTLQPLVENAMKHGFKEKLSDCYITISIEKHTDVVAIQMVDNGQGMDSLRLKQLFTQPIPSQAGNGLALYNINRRLTFMYGESAALQIMSTVGEGTTVSFQIPLSEVNKHGNTD